MELESIKKQMIKLWKENFHDSEVYIEHVFNNYFDPELIDYHLEKGEIVSALLGIPYDFTKGDKLLKGIYLCGLSTETGYRNKGIMSNLIERFSEKLKPRFDFIFLIPAEESLFVYYKNKGFLTAIYRCKENYTCLHDFYKDFLASIHDNDEKIKKLKNNLYNNLKIVILDEDNLQLWYDKLICFIKDYEKETTSYFILRHTEKDIKCIINENKISGGKIIISISGNDRVTGVAFINKRNDGNIEIPMIYYKDYASLYRLLTGIKVNYRESSISLYQFPENINRPVLADKYYGASNPDGNSLEMLFGFEERGMNANNFARPFGMIKILNYYNFFKSFINPSSDLKFSLIIENWPHFNKATLIKVDSATYIYEVINMEDMRNKYKSILSLTVREVNEILFRRKNSDNLIQEAFGIPRIDINICLLME